MKPHYNVSRGFFVIGFMQLKKIYKSKYKFLIFYLEFKKKCLSLYRTLKQIIMKTTINFYEGSYQYNSITTELNVSPDFIEMKLAKQYEYRATNESLWATIEQDSKEIARYELLYGIGLNEITIN